MWEDKALLGSLLASLVGGALGGALLLAFTNTVLIGLPLMTRAYGADAIAGDHSTASLSSRPAAR